MKYFVNELHDNLFNLVIVGDDGSALSNAALTRKEAKKFCVLQCESPIGHDVELEATLEFEDEVFSLLKEKGVSSARIKHVEPLLTCPACGGTQPFSAGSICEVDACETCGDDWDITELRECQNCGHVFCLGCGIPEN